MTGGRVANGKAGALLLERLPDDRIELADQGYDSASIRRRTEARGAAPHIPPKLNQCRRSRFSPVLCCGRDAIERAFGGIKDFRRSARR